MDVINLSLGEPEIDPARDIVVKAIDGAAAAGVVPVVAAGNDFDSFGRRGSIGSPGDAPRGAITVAASSGGSRFGSPTSSPASRRAARRPAPLQFKPDVTASGPPRILVRARSCRDVGSCSTERAWRHRMSQAQLRS